MRATRGSRAAVRVLLALVVALAGSFVLAPSARADDAGVEVTITSMTPQWLGGPGGVTDDANAAQGRLTITGTVTNTSAVPMSQVQVSLWRSFDPISDHRALNGVLGSPAEVPVGARTTSPDGNLFNITTEQSPTFAPGSKATFTVSATKQQLGLPEGDGVHLVGVHVRAIPQGAGNQLVGRSRVLLPSKSPERGSVSPVVVLSSRPSLVGDGVFVDDHLAGELDGRLEWLIKAAENPASVVLIDPNLYDELSLMSRGNYQLISGEADPAGQARASLWLARLTPLLSRSGVYRLPYGDPALLPVPDDAAPSVVGYARRALPDDHALASLGLALAPRSGLADARLVRLTAPLRPAVIVTQSTGRAPAGSASGVTVLNADPRFRAGGPGPAPSNGSAHIEGRLLAELALNPQPAAVLMVREAADVMLLQGLPSQVLIRPAVELPSTPQQVPEQVTVAAVDASLYGDIIRGRERIIAWGNLTGDTQASSLLADQVAARTASSSYRVDSYSARVFLSTAVLINGPEVRGADVRLTSAKSFVMSTDTTSFPVTVTNNEKRAVRVKVRFTSENPQRVVIPDSAVVTVAPGETVSVTFSPKAFTNGVVTVSAQVVTPDNTPVGSPRRITVTATSLGDIGWIIIIASGIVLLGTTALRIKQVQRERARAAAAVVTPPEVDLAAVADRQSLNETGRPHP